MTTFGITPRRWVGVEKGAGVMETPASSRFTPLLQLVGTHRLPSPPLPVGAA